MLCFFALRQIFSAAMVERPFFQYFCPSMRNILSGLSNCLKRIPCYIPDSPCRSWSRRGLGQWCALQPPICAYAPKSSSTRARTLDSSLLEVSEPRPADGCGCAPLFHKFGWGYLLKNAKRPLGMTAFVAKRCLLVIFNAFALDLALFYFPLTRTEVN